VSTNDAYLEPLRGDRRLVIRGGVLVDRVLFDGDRARGVSALVGEDRVEFTGGEVFLCAGAIYSPAILMRSGIGPAGHLRELGIPVLRDLPVGSRLNDHAAVDLELDLDQPAAEVTGKYAVSCLVRFSSGLAGAGRNDMGFGSFNLFGGRGGPARGVIFVTLFRAYSTGTIRLASPDPRTDPLIEFHLLSDQRDMLRMRDGVHRLLQLAAHPAVQSAARRLGIGEVHAEAGLPQGHDLDRWLLARCDTIGHPCATAPMGSDTDPDAVLDPDCRVRGLHGLRVADASSMPAAPRANNHLSCVMLAENLARRIATAAA
jgi:choline dehydrogenase